MGGTAAVADFNGDGKLDFVVATAAHDVKIFIGDGSGAFVSVLTMCSGIFDCGNPDYGPRRRLLVYRRKYA